jgi:hypothetical protein
VSVDGWEHFDTGDHIVHALKQLQWRLDGVRHWSEVGYCHKANLIDHLKMSRLATLDLQRYSDGSGMEGLAIHEWLPMNDDQGLKL